MECISTVLYSLLINSNSKVKIQPSKGIKQRDYLSPYIFILCVELLGRELLIQSENPKNHIGIQTHRSGPRIHYFMFADGCIIFAKASQKACSNATCNFHTSLVQFSHNIQKAMKRRLGEALNIPMALASILIVQLFKEELKEVHFLK